MTQATTWSLPLVGPSNPTDYSQRIDDSFDALLSGHSGSARPSYAVAGTLWQDTSVAGKTTIYFYDGATDILIQTVDTANDRVAYAPQPAVTVASAATTDIGAATSETVVVSGTTTITSLGTAADGTVRRVRFSGILTLTHNATSLILLGGANITTAAGDVAEFVSEGSGNWRCVSYQRANGLAPAFSNGSVLQSVSDHYSVRAVSTTVIPFDNTVPQITEGDALLSVSITPTSTTNKIRVKAFVPATADALRNLIAALFVNGGANAVATAIETSGGSNYFVGLSLTYEYTPGTLAAQTLAIRVGPAGGTFYINGAAGGDLFGGSILRSSLIVEEVKA